MQISFAERGGGRRKVAARVSAVTDPRTGQARTD